MDKSNTLTEFGHYVSARCRPGTAKVYVHALKLWFNYLDGGKPSQETAQSYVNHLINRKLSRSTINLRGHAIKRWFKWMGSPIELDYPTSVNIKEPEYLNIKEVEKVIAVCRTPLERALVIVLFDTAVRISELLNIRVDDIDWSRGLLSVTRKGGNRDLVNISDRGLKALREWLDSRQLNTERVFGSIEYYDVWGLLRSIGARVKLKLRPHMFRHSRAVFMLMNNASLHDVMMHLGHKSINTTAAIYGRYTAMDLKKRIPKW